MKTTSNQKEITIAILLAGILIAGSLAFLGMMVKQQSSLQTDEFVERIKREVLAEVQNRQSGREQLKVVQQVKAEVLKELQKGELLAQQIETGIEQYIMKQQEAQLKAQEEQQRLAQEKAKNVRPVSQERDHIYGNTEAAFSMIVYSDFECPYSKLFHQTMKKLMEASEGNVNWVYRHYPLPFHNPGAQKEAEAAECANELGGNEAFWKYTDLIYERTTSNGNGFPNNQLVPLAEEIGLDKAEFQTCFKSGKYAERIQEEIKEGANSGVSGTPGSILLRHETGGVKFISGALPLESLQQEIDRMAQ